MNITIIATGKLKEKYLIEASNEYIKRLKRFVPIEVKEINDEKIPDNASKKEEEIIKQKEGEKIISKIPKNSYVITLEIDAKQLSSIEFSQKINATDTTTSHICFIIGGSLGLSEEVKNKSNFALSFSKMTFPHQLFRILLLEQIYRAYKIKNNDKYHK